MKNTSTISLVICNYNRAKFIDRAIRSCLNQLIINRNIEVIVIDDASSDESLKVINEFSEEIFFFQNKKNLGISKSSNIGLKKASGSYWMRVDSDDFLNMHACNLMSLFLDANTEYSYVYCDHLRVDQLGNKIEKVKLDTQDKLFAHGAGILFRKSVLNQIGGYDKNLKNCEDYDLLLRLKKSGFLGYYLPIPLYRYYIHGKNITLTASRKKFKKIVEEKHGI